MGAALGLVGVVGGHPGFCPRKREADRREKPGSKGKFGSAERTYRPRKGVATVFGWERGDNGGVGLHVPSATKALVHTRQRMMRIAVGTKISTFDARSFDGDVP